MKRNLAFIMFYILVVIGIFVLCMTYKQTLWQYVEDIYEGIYFSFIGEDTGDVGVAIVNGWE